MIFQGNRRQARQHLLQRSHQNRGKRVVILRPGPHTSATEQVTHEALDIRQAVSMLATALTLVRATFLCARGFDNLACACAPSSDKSTESRVGSPPAVGENIRARAPASAHMDTTRDSKVFRAQIQESVASRLRFRPPQHVRDLFRKRATNSQF